MPAVTVSRSGRVARVVLDRPPVNVVDLATAGELAAALEPLRDDHDLCAVVLETRGRVFSAGVDVRDHLPDRGAAMLRAFHRACNALGAVAAPTVARVHGAALGGGCELTLMCDVVVAAESASFALPEIELGVFPPLAAVALPRMIAAHVAWEMILAGRALEAPEALAVGLANRVVPAARLDAEVEDVVATFASLSPASLALAKRVMALARVRPTPLEVDEAERFYVEHLMHTPDAIEGLTAFIEKRAAAWGTVKSG
uniref:Enoyl-CoA hydratase n=1 Tax=Eiseniibacteriota bacterium TaxID=2212470 RepID=A0A832I2T0_UNCEI